MALELGKRKPDDQFRDELRVLAVQIETINQQLAMSNGGSGPAMTKNFTDINSKLSFLYEYLKTLDTEIKSQTKSSMEQVGASVNATLQKNLGDIYARQEETRKAVTNIKGGGGGANQADIDDIRNTLKELIKVYREEVEVFRSQNQFLQKKLIDIEVRLGKIEK